MSLPEFCEFLMQTPSITSQSGADFGHIGTLGSFVLTQILRPPKGEICYQSAYHFARASCDAIVLRSRGIN